jgi:GTP-binding protein
LVDLPGYGWAQVSKSLRKGFSAMIEGYITRRTNLCCTFVLVDIRHEPQAIDLNFIRWMGENGLPIAIVFTKADKLKSEAEALRHVDAYRKVLLQEWEETPPCFITSADKRHGLDALLAFIHEANGRFVPV